jgi:rubrerythrin
MTAQSTLKDVLKMAIRKEIEAQHLYTYLAKLITNPAAIDAFRELAQQEEGHQNMLEQYLRGELKEGALVHGQNIDYKITEALDQPEVSLDMELKDAFLLAANREKSSHDFYLGLAGIHPAGKVKTLLEELAAQELAHKQRVEFLYTEVAFPQTDGG